MFFLSFVFLINDPSKLNLDLNLDLDLDLGLDLDLALDLETLTRS